MERSRNRRKADGSYCVNSRWGLFITRRTGKSVGMMQLNHHMFFFQWQLLHDATKPKDLTDHWTVDGVDWDKGLQSFHHRSYSAQIQIHQLTCRRGEKIDWQLLVVIEEWWGPDRKKPIRSHNWCKANIGDSKKIVAWMKKQDSKRQAKQPDETKFVNLPEEKSVLH